MNTIYLFDHSETVKAACLKRNQLGHDYSLELIDQAISIHLSDDLRYNLTSGQTRNNSIGVISEFVNKSDIPVYESDSDAAEWAFCGMIRNTANMIKNGFIKP